MTGQKEQHVSVFSGDHLDMLCERAILFCGETIKQKGSIIDVVVVAGESGTEVHVHWLAASAAPP